jgi:hypothetical protein
MKIRQALIVTLMLATSAVAATPSLIILPNPPNVFPPQAVGAIGPGKTVTIQLSQTGSLQVTGTTATPPFTASNSCNGDLPPAIVCPIPITFVAQAAGPAQGMVSISYTSSAAATQSTSVCGTGLSGPGDFTVGFVFDCFATATGTSSVFNLAVYPNAFNGTANLSCTTAASSVPCTVSPATVTLSGSTAVNITVTANSATSRVRSPHLAPRRALGMLGLEAIVLLCGAGRGVRRRAAVCLALSTLVAVVLVGCGGSSTIKVPQITSVTITATGSNAVTHQSSLTLSAP